MLQKVGQHRKDSLVSFDELSAARLIEDGRAEAVDGVSRVDGFDPSAHDVDGVNDYLAGASPAEQHRVLALERAGKARKGVLEA